MKRNHAIALALVACVVLFLGLPGCGAQEDEHEPGGHEGEQGEHDEQRSEAVRLSSDQLAASDIRIAEAGPAAIDSGIELPGEVRPNGDRLAHIVPRFPGHRARSAQERRRRRPRRRRARDHREQRQPRAVRAARRLIDGIVIDKHLDARRGGRPRRTRRSSSPISRTVWVDLSRLPEGSRARRRRAARAHPLGRRGARPPRARSRTSTPAVDQATRTATARVVLDNAERSSWRPGCSSPPTCSTGTAAAVAVPARCDPDARWAVRRVRRDGRGSRPACDHDRTRGRDAASRCSRVSPPASASRSATRSC